MYKIDEQVSHKGNLWDVVSEFGGLIKIKRQGETKTVRLNQVAKVDIDRKYKV